MPQHIPVVENILSANDRLALENQAELDAAGVFAVNIMASPGAGKTSLIEHTVRGLAGKLRLGMINGDVATSLDADRAQAAGAVAIQINTGGDCHLDAVMVHSALLKLNLTEFDLLIIENVGNLICPASFKLGTHKSVLVASIPEGDDKPYKYPGIFTAVEAVVINKMDLAPYVDFDLAALREAISGMNRRAEIFEVSCRTGEGIDRWADWLWAQWRAYRNREMT